MGFSPGDIRRLPRHTLQTHLLEQHLHENRSPRVGCVRRDGFVEFLVPGGLFLSGHQETLVDRGGNVLWRAKEVSMKDVNAKETNMKEV